MNRLLAIDPGNIKSGYVLVEFDESDITKVIDVGKVENEKIYDVLADSYDHLAIEMIAGMGMTVGAEVFETCVWIGRFLEHAEHVVGFAEPKRIYRREEKLDLCGTPTAKDSNIRQALCDRYAAGKPNYGKGTKNNKGFFYGFSADMLAAMAVAVTYYDKYIKGVKI